ncbi:outer membrane porin, OprD family [compost metagenome]
MHSKALFLAGLVGCSVVVNANAGGFIEDSRTAVRYSQFYWKENHDGGVGPTRDEWVQAALFNFNSGWFHDILGLDYSYGLADDLNVGDDATSISNLEAGNTVQSPHGIAKPIEAYLRSRLDTDVGVFNAGVGKKIRRYGQYRDDVTRILPASTVGFDLAYNAGGLELRYSDINAFSPRNENGWGDDLSNFQGKKIDQLQLYALSYRLPEGSNLRFEYALSEDYLREAMVKWERSFELAPGRNLDLYVTHGMQEDAGKLFEYGGVPGLYDPQTSHDARFTDVSAKYRFGAYYLGMSYDKVSGDDFDRLFFAKDHGTWDSSAKLFYYFGVEDEEMFKYSGGMTFADLGLPQLSLDVYYAMSDHAAGYNGFSRREFQSILQYNFSGWLKGLNLAWLHDEFHTKGEADGVTRFTNSLGPAGIITHNAERVYLNYVYTF